MASALENYVNVVRTLSASGNFDILVDQLNNSIELLTKNSNILDNVLETLDIQQHSLGVLYVLLAKFSNALGLVETEVPQSYSILRRPFEFLFSLENKIHPSRGGRRFYFNYEWNANAQNTTADAPHLLRLFKDFITLCNGEQVRFASHSYYELCHLFTNFIVRQPSCIHGIKIVAHAVDKIRLFDSQLTAVHADLCLLSLEAKCFKTALKFLDIDITSIADSSSSRGAVSVCFYPLDEYTKRVINTNHDAKYFLLYYYYGGMIYTAMKNYDRALYFFEVAVSTPALAMSHIMLESYKKFILVSLILHGKILNIPKYSSQVISRFMKPLSQSYLELATAYGSTSSDELRTVVNKYSNVFVTDTNMGLVKQVQSSLYKKNIQRLTKTFLTLSLPDVASRVQLATAAEAEKYILDMIKAGEIYATINQKDGMVVFKDDPEKYNTPEMFLKVQDDMNGVMELIKQINKMEEEIVLNPTYVKKAIGNQEDEIASGQHSKTYSGDPTE